MKKLFKIIKIFIQGYRFGLKGDRWNSGIRLAAWYKEMCEIDKQNLKEVQ